MAREFINPNWHVALVHFPLGLLIAGTLIELLSFLWRRHAFRGAGRWMILLGALSSVPAALSGIYALADVSRIGLAPEDAAGTWAEVAAVSPLWQNHEQAHLMRDHVVLQSFGAGVALFVVVVWMGASDLWRARLHLPLLALLLISTGLTIAGSWHAGEAVYRYGTGVELAGEATTQPSIAPTEVAQEAGAAPAEQRWLLSQVEYLLPPLQMHTVAAGATIALALAAIGLSFRAANSGPPRTDADNIAAALGPAPTEPTSASVIADLDRGRRRPRDPLDAGPRVPSARFWMLTFLVGLLTALGGFWMLSIDSEIPIWKVRELWQLASAEAENATRPWLTRRLAHIGGGASIVVLSLLLALVARVMPRSRLVLSFFTLLLLAVVAVQVWFGVLLMFDTVDGPVTRFN